MRSRDAARGGAGGGGSCPPRFWQIRRRRRAAAAAAHRPYYYLPPRIFDPWCIPVKDSQNMAIAKSGSSWIPNYWTGYKANWLPRACLNSSITYCVSLVTRKWFLAGLLNNLFLKPFWLLMSDWLCQFIEKFLYCHNKRGETAVKMLKINSSRSVWF